MQKPVSSQPPLTGKNSKRRLKSDFFGGGRRLRHRLSCSYSHELATSSSGSSSSSLLYKFMFSFFCKETFKWWNNLWSLIEGNFERKFYCLAFEKKYYRKDFVIKLARLNNRKLPKVGMQELLRPPSSIRRVFNCRYPIGNKTEYSRVLRTFSYVHWSGFVSPPFF